MSEQARTYQQKNYEPIKGIRRTLCEPEVVQRLDERNNRTDSEGMQ